jgi:CheY-like chemotaxis protein
MSVPVIVLIEDSVADVFLLRTCLDRIGEQYRLELLADGEAALAYIAEFRSGRREPHPCVILLDLHLPKHSGAQVLAAIRQEPALEHVHVVVLTSSASPHQRTEIEKLGALIRAKPSTLPLMEEFAAAILELCKGIPFVSA